MERRLTARGKERRQQLMDFAAARFAEGGYHPTSVAEIVQGLGVGKGVFYWYFDSKEQLFLEILKDAQTAMRRAQRVAYGDEPDPIRRIELGIRASLTWLDAHRDMLPLFQFAATEEQFAPAMRRGQDVAVADVVRHIKDGIVEGTIRDVDPEILAHGVLGVTNQLSRVYVRDRLDGVGVIDEAAVAFCLVGLRGP
jgi:AcrR family transcriptional regulator